MKHLDNTCVAAANFFNCMGEHLHNKRAYNANNDITVFGEPKLTSWTANEKCALEMAMSDVIPDKLLLYDWAIINNQMIRSEKYRHGLCCAV